MRARPGPYTWLLFLLLAVLAVIVGWMYHALNSPEVREAVAKAKKAPQAPQTAPVASVPPPASAPTGVAQHFSSGGVDAELQTKADRLHASDSPPLHDLEIISEFLETYAKGTGGQPVGDNADITAALTGTQFPGQKQRVFPMNHRAVKSGQLVDRWGQALWFHPNSGSSMEIRSGGPDKQLFTQDDIVLNPSPAGLGATPAENKQ